VSFGVSSLPHYLKPSYDKVLDHHVNNGLLKQGDVLSVRAKSRPTDLAA
jgi:hypothetical protein